MKYVLYRTLRTTLRPLFMVVFNPKYIGVENIPKNDAVILAGNHTNPIDALLMLGGPKRIVHMMAKKELYSNFITRWFFRSMACISVDRSIHDENAKNEAVEVLNKNEMIGIFPEGTINKTDKVILPFKYGAVSFAKKTGAYIVPFAIKGKYSKRNVKLVYGKPYKVNGDLEEENKKLMNKVEKLLTEGEKNEKHSL